MRMSIGPTFRFERFRDSSDHQPQPLEHLRKHRIRLKLYGILLQFHFYVTITEMICGAKQQPCI